MSTPTTPTVPVTQQPTLDKFSFDKSTSKGLTLIRMKGTLDHAFEGRKVAGSITTKKVIVDMRDVKRLASWGMSEWMEFLRMTSGRDVYLIECSTYAVSQLNLVTGLLGHSKLVSFYAAYRCASCNASEDELFLVPRDRDQIRHLPESTQDCRLCGGLARLEEYPAAFFDSIADRQLFDVDDEVLAHLRSHYKYDLRPDTMRFRAYRKVDKEYTYIRISGGLATLQPEPVANAAQGTAVIDLKEAFFDNSPQQITPWRAFMKAVLPRVKQLQLVDCPPFFLESAILSEDLHDRVKVRTMQIAYDCARCHTRTTAIIDVAENLEELVTGTAPAAICSGCKAAALPTLSLEEQTRLRQLPARDRDPALDKFLAKARTEPQEKLEDCLSIVPKPEKSAKGGMAGIYAAIGLSTLVIGGLVVGFVLWNKKDQPANAGAGVAGPLVVPPPEQPEAPKFERPDWVVVEPSAGYCHDMINRLMCVGVSSFHSSRDEGVAEANEVALEELVNAVGLKITEPTFRDRIITSYASTRSKLLTTLQAAQIERGSAYVAAHDPVQKTRRRVVEVLQASGGPAVPAQRTDWYWEQYEAKDGGTEYLVFIRYDVSNDAVKALVEKYSAQTPVLGSTAMTAFPALAWADPEFGGGVTVANAKGPLKDAGVADLDVITAVGDQKIADVPALTRRIDDVKKAGTGDLSLSVKTGTAAPRDVVIPRGKIR